MGVAMLMALALSLDGFGVGFSYGLRRIRIPFFSLMAIAMCSVFAMGISMLFGNWLTLWFKFVPASFLGAAILLAMGVVQLARAIWNRKRDGLPQAIPAMAVVISQPIMEPVFKFQLNFFGLVIQVLKAPHIADIDGSGGISFKESILLGSALAVDAFAGGIGAALAGMAITVVGIVGLTQILMLLLGQQLAGKIPENWVTRAEYLPGAVLILVGVVKLI